ncbi:MAG: IS256 family transposase, partial [bacterium]
RKGHDQSDQPQGGVQTAVTLNRAVEEWKRPPREWCEGKTQFAILFGDRFVV